MCKSTVFYCMQNRSIKKILRCKGIQSLYLCLLLFPNLLTIRETPKKPLDVTFSRTKIFVCFVHYQIFPEPGSSDWHWVAVQYIIAEWMGNEFQAFWSNPFLLSGYIIHYSLAWSWSLSLSALSSLQTYENPTHSLMFGSFVTIFMKPSLILPASHQIFFSFPLGSAGTLYLSMLCYFVVENTITTILALLLLSL